jgi:UDP-glucose:(heptosyl)LPS alpha-1,3-glucosyltransferase
MGEVDVVIGFNHSVVQDVYRLGGGTHAEFMRLTERLPSARGGPVLDRAALALERKRFAPGRFLRLIAPSRRVKDELIRHYGIDDQRIDVVWNGIDRARFRALQDPDERSRVRASWGASEDEPLLLFVGQDPERKGFAAAREVARALGVRLVYVGPARIAAENGVLAAGVRADIEACYRAADALIAPSTYDPFGGAVLEAIACGLPAVATDRIGSTERFMGTALEELFVQDPGDHSALLAATRRALDRGERERFRAAAASRLDGADASAWGDQMEAILRRAARERASGEARQ